MVIPDDSRRYVIIRAADKSNINFTEIGFEQFQFSSKSFPMTSWFAGQIFPGERTTASFTINNPTNLGFHISFLPNILISSATKIESPFFNGLTRFIFIRKLSPRPK